MTAVKVKIKIYVLNIKMAGTSTSNAQFQFVKPCGAAPKAVGNSFKKFTETLQYSEYPKPAVKKQNSPNFVPLPIPRNNPPLIRHMMTHVINKTIEVAPHNEEIVTTNINKKTEPKPNFSSSGKISPHDLMKTMKLATGTVESTLKWFKKFDSQLMLYEVYANVLSIRQGKHLSEKVLLLRNSTGPVLQAVFYEIDVNMPSVRNGDLVRCVGRSLDNSRLHVFKITKINAREMQNAARLMTISNFSLNK